MAVRHHCIATAVALFLAGLFQAGIAQGTKRLSFEQLFRAGEPKILKSLPECPGWKDGKHFLLAKTSGEKVTAVSALDSTVEPYRDFSAFKTIADTNVALNEPDSHSDDWSVLLYQEHDTVCILDTNAHTWKHPVVDAENPTLSPDGRHLAFTRKGELYVVTVKTGEERRLTHDGSDVINNGRASWVYYEEIFGRESQYRAFWWSPDSRRLAFYRFDDSSVPLYPLFDYAGSHGEPVRTHYPQPGDPNPKVVLMFADVDNNAVQRFDSLSAGDCYLGPPTWTPDSKDLMVQWMDRAQKELRLIRVSPVTGKAQVVYNEHQKSWVEWIERLWFFNHGALFLTGADGWMHIYYSELNGQPPRQLTSGPWTVTDIAVIDSIRQRIFFTARKENSCRTDLYVTGVHGGGPRRLTEGEFTHIVYVAPAGEYFLDVRSNLTTPPAMILCDSLGRTVRVIADSRTAAFNEYSLAGASIIRHRTDDGYDLPCAIRLPFDFDTTRSYPVLISVYGGPNGGTVYDRWGTIREQWLAEEGVIQISIDHRGSGHFGKKGEWAMYRNLGKWEMHDYGEVVKWLRTLKYVDSTRICITGGSYGGYIACLALTQEAAYFPLGLSLFPVTDWRLYDSHYTERYMDAPPQNPDGYAAGSVLTYVSKYRGLLKIIHGTGDDNVHVQNTMQLVDALENKGKHVEMVFYPDQKHGWGGKKARHLQAETYRFYYDHLIGKPFPEALFSKP